MHVFLTGTLSLPFQSSLPCPYYTPASFMPNVSSPQRDPSRLETKTSLCRNAKLSNEVQTRYRVSYHASWEKKIQKLQRKETPLGITSVAYPLASLYCSLPASVTARNTKLNKENRKSRGKLKTRGVDQHLNHVPSVMTTGYAKTG